MSRNNGNPKKPIFYQKKLKSRQNNQNGDLQKNTQNLDFVLQPLQPKPALDEFRSDLPQQT